MANGMADGMEHPTASQSSTLQPSALAQAGLAQTSFKSASLSFHEVTAATLIRVHTLAAPEVTVAALAACGFPASVIPNASTGGERMAMCLRPGEWLLFSEQAASDALLGEVRGAVDPATNSVLPQSDGLACFRLAGPGVPWLLSKLSALDYFGGSSKGQHCARTRLAQVTVLVNHHPGHATTGSFVYDLIFDRSIAAYLWNLLLRNAPHADELAQANV